MVSLLASIGATVVTIVTLPFIVYGMGLAAYGLFALFGVASSLMGTLDFGFGWTSSRFVADALEQKDDRLLKNVLRVSLLLYVLIGVIGCVVLILIAPLLVQHVFQVPARLQGVGIESARIFALAFPTAMLQVYAGAVVRGARRFDLNSGFQLVPPTLTSLAIVGTVCSAPRWHSRPRRR